MQPIDRAHLQRLEPTARFFRSLDAFGFDVVPVGSFRVLLHRESDDLDDSQALPYEPMPDREQTLRELREVRDLFEARGRIPAIELNEAYWPDLPALVEESGFREYKREPLMYCVPGEFRPVRNPAVGVRFLNPADPDRDLVAYQTIFFHVMFDQAWEPTAERVARFRAEVDRVKGRSHALASLEGEPAGTGFISSNDGVGEIARVATMSAARRQGVAATLTSFMMEDRFANLDELIWLTAQAPPARALYQKLGYRLAGDRVYYRTDSLGANTN